jgi:hypothetical protein
MTHKGTLAYDLHVWWSIYVKAKDMGKAKREHFPPIEAIIGTPAVPFQYFKEEGGLLRMVAYKNLPASDMKTAVNQTLETAYSMADGWRIYGLGCLATGRYRHIAGLWSADKPSHQPPRLESMMFEIERGLTETLDQNGGVSISDYDRTEGPEDFVANPLRLRPPQSA